MTKTKTRLLILCIALQATAVAQSSLRNKKTFERSLSAVIVSAADQFEFVKGKTKKDRIAEFPSKQFEPALLFPGVDDAAIIQVNKSTSLFYMRVAALNDFSEAFQLYTNLIKQTEEALRKRIYFCTDTLNQTEGEKLSRGGIKTMTGFFAPSVFIGILKKEKYELYMKVNGGLPDLYSIIPKGQGGQSLLFRFQFNKAKDMFDRDDFFCTELPGYVCGLSSGLCASIVYTKTTDEELNAQYEFSNLFTEVKAALKDEYVYQHRSSGKTILNETVFIRKSDICEPEKKSIVIKLEKINAKHYEIKLAFNSMPTVVLLP